MSVHWIEYQNKKILFVDYYGLDGDKLIQTLHEALRIVTLTPGKTLILYNFKGTSVNQNFMNEAKATSKPDGESQVEKAAIIGIDPLKALLLNGYNRVTGQKIKSFKSEDDAKEWLIQP